MLLIALILAEASAPVPSADPAFFDWKLLLAFAGAAILMFMTPRLIRRTADERRELARQCDREVAGQVQIKSQVDKIMVELVSAGQEINAQLDTKMRVLNRLVRDAEAVAKRLEQQLTRLEQCSACPPKNESFIAVSGNGVADNRKTETAGKYDPAKDTVLMEPPANRPTITAANVARDPNTDSGRWRIDIRQKIEQHHREHRTPAEIARLLHLSLSEVNLVIDMYEARLR